jgi:hypothetical protein
MSDNQKSPFEDFPKTAQSLDADGKTVFTITPRVLTTARARLANIASNITIPLGAAGTYFQLDRLTLPEAWLPFAGASAVILSFPFWEALFHALFQKRVKIVLSATEVRVRRLFRWKAYDRTLPHSFALIPHDRTKAEAKRHEFLTKEAQKDGEVIQFTEYCGDSVHLCLVYAGQRVDIATIYGRKDALAILARLQLCDATLDAETGVNGGLALSPDQEAGSQPGDLPLS